VVNEVGFQLETETASRCFTLIGPNVKLEIIKPEIELTCDLMCVIRLKLVAYSLQHDLPGPWKGQVFGPLSISCIC
jgi:hypothetical protein